MSYLFIAAIVFVCLAIRKHNWTLISVAGLTIFFSLMDILHNVNWGIDYLGRIWGLLENLSLGVLIVLFTRICIASKENGGTNHE